MTLLECLLTGKSSLSAGKKLLVACISWICWPTTSPEPWVVSWLGPLSVQDSHDWTQLPYRWDRGVLLAAPSASVACLDLCHSVFLVSRGQSPFPVEHFITTESPLKAPPWQLVTKSLQSVAAGWRFNDNLPGTHEGKFYVSSCYRWPPAIPKPACHQRDFS